MDKLSELINKSRMVDLFVNMICATSHLSGAEEALLLKVEKWARGLGLETRRDQVGNLAIFVPGTGKFVNSSKALLCQCHADMVGSSAPGTTHDFINDPVKVCLDQGWLVGRGTTIGADNGLGMAMVMAAAERRDTDRCPFVILFTVDEERRMSGARKLNPQILFPDKVELIGGLNLDSEEGEGVIFIGSAGCDIASFMIENKENRADLFQGIPFRLSVSGLAGGHSGIDLDKGRQNAIFVAARFMDLAVRESFSLVSGCGGTRTGRIPSECELCGYILPEEFHRLKELLPNFVTRLRDEVSPEDKNVQLTLEPADRLDAGRWPGICSMLILKSFLKMPNGVMDSDRSRRGCNVGVFKLTPSECLLEAVILSDDDYDRYDLKREIIRPWPVWSDNVSNFSPAWPSRGKNPIRLAALRLWPEAFGCEPKQSVSLGPLECGQLTKRLEIPMISFGGKIDGAHEPHERASVESWLKVESGFRFLLKRLINEVE